MSRFKQAINVLVSTSKPVFIRMGNTDAALPLMRGIDTPAMFGLPRLRDRKKIAKALATLASSKRYLAAVAAEGSMRHDINGHPVEPVSEAHRAWAVEESARIKAKDARKRQCLSALNALSTVANETGTE